MRRQRGFTLLEVIIAFALLAVALTLLLGSLSGASKQVRAADQATRASLHAQSLLAQLGVGERLQPGHSEGEFEGGRYRWQLDVAPYVDPIANASPMRDPGMPELLQLRLEMRWGQGPRERATWDSLRLVPADPNRGRRVP